MAQQVIVVGSLHYDIMVDAPDRPRKGETVTGYRWHPKFGGKGGNQAVAAARAGVKVRFVGAVGDDDFGPFLLKNLAGAGVDCQHVATVNGMGSGMSVAITDDGGDYGAVIVSGANTRIDPARLDADAIWQDAAVLLLQNEVPPAINLAAAQAAHRRGLKVWLNAAPARALEPDFAALVDLLIVNAIEAEQMGTAPVTDLASAARAAEALSARFAGVVVTAGGDGVAGVMRGQGVVTIPALPVTLVSTHGAGDAFVGTLLAAHVGGASFVDNLRAANAAAAQHVSAPRPA